MYKAMIRAFSILAALAVPLGIATGALAAARQTDKRIAQLSAFPVATGVTIYKGGMVCLNAGGYAVPAADTAGLLPVIGVADETVANAGADGALKIRVQSGFQFKFAASSITQAMVGDPMFVVDDQTFDDNAGSTHNILAGILVEYVSTTSGWLYIPSLGESGAAGGVNSVLHEQLAGGFAKVERVAGQDETGDTTIPVTGIAVGDELVAVFVEDGTSGKWTQRALTDFTIATAGNITVGANAANNAANAYIVFWNDLTA